jgi:hypothetical protein
MLDAVFEGWISGLGERAFDETLLTLLRAQGFYDIHFTHGPYEFGKDFIAKRDEPSPVQYAFQSKAGDIGGSEWSALLGQLEELIGTQLTHANFDKSLKKRFILVTTGRLKGKAVIGPSDFRERLEKSGRGTFECWEKDTLVELFHGSSRFPVRPSASLEPLLGRIVSGLLSDRDLETGTSALIPGTGSTTNEAYRSLLDTYLCAGELLRSGRPFQAIIAALAAIRTAAVLAHSSGTSPTILHASLDQLVLIGDAALGPLFETAADPDAWLDELGGTVGKFITYPVACLRTLEYLGLAALHSEHSGSEQARATCVELIEQVLARQPGSFHPISDRYAASIAPPVAALARAGRKASVERIIRETTKWVCDVYERSEFGLGGPYSTPQYEVSCLLGAAFEDVALQPRRESLLAVALADAAYVFAPSLYPAVVNDLLAVGIHPTAVHAKDESAAYFLRGFSGTQALVNVRYPADAGTALLPHHALQTPARVPENMAGAAVPLALACLLRDRLFTDCLPRLRAASAPQ